MRCACVSYQLFVRDNVYASCPCEQQCTDTVCNKWTNKWFRSSVLHTQILYICTNCYRILLKLTNCSRTSLVSVYHQYSFVMCSNSLFSVGKLSRSVFGETTVERSMIVCSKSKQEKGGGWLLSVTWLWTPYRPPCFSLLYKSPNLNP